MKRHASAVWTGNLKQGEGRLSTHSKVLADTPYSFHTRFEDGDGTNPEELIGAAHAGCFSMALSLILEQAGFTPESVETRAAVSLDQVEDGFAITAIHLTVNATVPDANAEQFDQCANDARAGCPVSRVLNADITMDATLDSQAGNHDCRMPGSRSALGIPVPVCCPGPVWPAKSEGRPFFCLRLRPLFSLVPHAPARPRPAGPRCDRFPC